MGIDVVFAEASEEEEEETTNMETFPRVRLKVSTILVGGTPG